MATSNLDRELRSLATELGLDSTDDVIDECVSDATTYLNAPYADPPANDDRREGDGSYSDNPALLHIYDTPRQSSSSGPLEGISMVIKDNMAVKGLRMTCGLQAVSFVPDYDAVIVERLLDAGASIIGKANMDGLAVGPDGVHSEFEQVPNPIYEDRVPGGSSSGSACAVASGLADAALGSDTGGSVRLPAAYCGLVGAKPTLGLTPRHGLVPLAPSLDTIGPITQSVRTAAEILEGMIGPDPRDPTATHHRPPSMTADLDSPPPLRFGIPDGFVSIANEEIQDAIADLADRIDNDTESQTTPIELSNEIGSAYPHISGPEFAWLLRQSGVNHGHGFWYDPGWRQVFAALRKHGLNDHITKRKLPVAYVDTVTESYSYTKARTEAIQFREELNHVFETVDLLLMPTDVKFPAPINETAKHTIEHSAANTKPFNLAGTPAIAVPIGNRDGLPVSAQVVAPAFHDHKALQGARLIETLT